MILLLSSTKTMNESAAHPGQMQLTSPQFIDEAHGIMTVLKSMSEAELSQVLSVKGKLLETNQHRIKSWSENPGRENASAAVFAFAGELYKSLQAETLGPTHLQYVMQNVRILSGLYGLLKPFDAIMPYRLEMATKLRVSKAKDLYQFWKDKITACLEREISEGSHAAVINLASQEYIRAVETSKLGVSVITPLFKYRRNGKLVNIMSFAKQARGAMARHLIINRSLDAEDMKSFPGFAFSPDLSTSTEWVFIANED